MASYDVASTIRHSLLYGTCPSCRRNPRSGAAPDFADEAMAIDGKTRHAVLNPMQY
jgi:hypothetical protein